MYLLLLQNIPLKTVSPNGYVIWATESSLFLSKPSKVLCSILSKKASTQYNLEALKEGKCYLIPRHEQSVPNTEEHWGGELSNMSPKKFSCLLPTNTVNLKSVLFLENPQSMCQQIGTSWLTVFINSLVDWLLALRCLYKKLNTS